MNKWFTVSASEDRATVRIFGEIIGESADHLIEQTRNARQVFITVNSPGGDGSRSMAVYKALRARDTHVRIRIQGWCSSAAILIAMAGNDIEIERDAHMLLHRAARWCFGNADELREESESLHRFELEQREILIERTKQPAAIVDGWMSGPDFYLTAPEAVACGLAHRIVEPAPVSQSPFTIAAVSESKPDDSRIFLDFLVAFGDVSVASKKKFGRELAAWFALKVKEHE